MNEDNRSDGPQSQKTGASGRQEFGPPPTDWRKIARLSAWGVITLLAAIFIFSNSEEVNVNLVVVQADMPLYVALLVSLGFGLLIGSGGMWLTGRRRARRAQGEPTDKKS